MIFAEILDGINAAQLGGYGLGALALMAVWMKMNGFEKAVADRVKLLNQAADAPGKREISPQPLVVKEEQVYATVRALEKHETDDDAEHKRIHIRIDHVRDSLVELSREVSATQSTLEANGTRLLLMDQKIDRLLERQGTERSKS